MNGKYKFCALWTCGCVLSERALKEVESDTCHSCGMKFGKEDIIILNAEGDDLVLMEENMKIRREKLKALRREKKEKKGEKRKADQKMSVNGHSGVEFTKPLDIGATCNKKSKELDTHQNGGTATLMPSKKASSGKSSSSSSKKVSKEAKTSDSNEVVLDPTKSKVYKSLFTSGQSSKSRGKDQSAHWITYNPYHL